MTVLPTHVSGSNGIYGRAATGLQDTLRAVNENVAKIGAKGEQKTEVLLDGFAKNAAVLHDLRIPLPGFKANIDHAIVSGKSVLLIDSSPQSKAAASRSCSNCRSAG